MNNIDHADKGTEKEFKVIESAELLRLAQKKAKDSRIYFDSMSEIEEKSPEAQILFFAFLYIEALYAEQKINSKVKRKYEASIEKQLQYLAGKLQSYREVFEYHEKALIEKMQCGAFSEALPIALRLLDFSQTNCVDSRYSGIYRHYFESNKKMPDD